MVSPLDVAQRRFGREAQARRDLVLAPYESQIDVVQHLYDHFAKSVNDETTCALMVQATIMLTPIEDA